MGTTRGEPATGGPGEGTKAEQDEHDQDASHPECRHREAQRQDAETDEAHPETADRRHGRNYLWAELMRRSMALDVTTCLRCGGRLRLIAVIDDPAVVQRVLRYLGLPTQIPKARPAHAPPTDVAALLSRGSKAGWGCVG